MTYEYKTLDDGTVVSYPIDTQLPDISHQIFIFNWKNQEDKVNQKIQQFREINYDAIVINSDDSLKNKYNWIHLGEQAYFTEQFNTAVKLFNTDLFIHIQGDASYHDWYNLISDAKKYYSIYKYGIYAPNVYYTNWHGGVVNKQPLSNNLWEVSNTDCTCWFIHKDILSEFEPVDLSKNKLGWGIDWYIMNICNAKNRKIIRDYNHTISHPKHTNYDTKQAETELLYMNQKIQSFICKKDTKP